MFLVGTGVVPPYDNPDAWDATAKDFFTQMMAFDAGECFLNRSNSSTCIL